MNKTDADLLAEYLGDEVEPVDALPPAPTTPPPESEGWNPDLNPTQKKIFDEMAENVLGHAEKGSGKTIGFGHKMVRHCYENDNALALCITPMIRTGNEGIWYDLETLVLPHWKEGMDLEYTSSRLDPLTKDRHRWIRNRFGGWSKILLMSIPHASQVEQRITGPAPSMVYVDELDKCDGDEYWKFPSAQLGRRRGIVGPQQFCASCNPKGPSHWVYKIFFMDCAKRADGTNWTEANGGRMWKDGIVRDPEFAVYHVPIAENLKRLPKGYIERLQRIFASDPVRWKRLIGGEWIDEPTGEGIFQGFYLAGIHKRGDLIKRTGLEPKRGFPIYVGYDIGQVWQGITFLQCIPTADKVIWIIFDETDHLKERILYKMLAWEVIARMRYWRKRVGYPFQYCHITDESAINQWRPGGEGGYDAWEFEREFNKVLSEFSKIGAEGQVQPAKMLGCPKGPGSVSARVRLIQGKLFHQELFVSAQCENAVDCLNHLEKDKDDPTKPKRSKWLHKFDSFSYPIFKLEVGNDPNLILPTPRQSGVRLISMR